MFGLGIWEIVIILLAVIIFIKPEDLPKFFRKVGNVYGQIKRYNREVVRKIRHIEYEVKEPFESIIIDRGNRGTPYSEKKKSDKKTKKHGRQ
jgi:Sec-independent protein translocase protein TatA